MADPQIAYEPRTLCEYFSQWDEYEGTIWYDEFDAAFVGFAWQASVGPIVVYDQDKVIDILVANGDDESEDPYMDALDHFGFNVQGQYVGDRTPMFLSDVGDRAVQDFLKRKAGAEISGWAVKIAANGIMEIN